MCFNMRLSLFYVIVVLYGWLIIHVKANLSDLPLLSDGYDIVDYLVNYQNQAAPWIVTNFPNTDSIEQHFVPIFSDGYPTMDVDTITNHLGSVNHIKNQFGNVFIPSVVDNALNSLMNSDAILTQSSSVVQIANEQQSNNENDDGGGGGGDDDNNNDGGNSSVGKSIDHIHDAVSIHKPFGGYKKQPITSVQRPINLNIPSHPLFVPVSHAHIYPMHIPFATTTTTTGTNTAPFLKKVFNFNTAASDKYVLSTSDQQIVPYKKSPLLVHFSHAK